MEALRSDRPSWDRLYEVAAAQDGMFTTSQAENAGYSTHLLRHHIEGGRIIRVRRGVYRLVHFPAGEHEDLVTTWLWSEQAGVFSHQTALMLLGLSDVLPAHHHLTLPDSWRGRRLRVPDGVVLHFGDVPDRERKWFGAVPMTAAARTLVDCAHESVSPELLLQAARQALRRGLVQRSEIREVATVLKPFGGLA